MNLHYITRSSEDAINWPFAQTLNELFPSFKAFASTIDTNYRSKLELIFIIYPKIFFITLKNAVKSAKLNPHYVILESDIEIISYCFIKLLFNSKTKICFSCFIYTGGEKSTLNLKYLYYRFVLSLVDLIIVHSSSEVQAYSKIFCDHSIKFRFVHYGIGAPCEKVPYGAQKKVKGLIVSAGRSNRDYQLLLNVARRLPYKFEIICDSAHSIPDCIIPPNVVFLRNCHGNEYISKLHQAEIVVIPLARDDISAGQMVLLHAMAYRKPIIASDCISIKNYVLNDNTLRLVPLGSENMLKRNIEELMTNYELRCSLAEKAGKNYDNNFTPEEMAKGFAEEIRKHASE